MLDIGPTIRQALAQCHERWDGAGGPKRLKGEEIRLPARVFNVAHQADLFNRLGGVDAAVAVLRRGRGKVYEPRLADHFCRLAPRLLSRLESEPAWDAVLSAEPGSPRWLAPDELDAVGLAIANFADIRSPYTVGHSAGVAVVAEAAARGLRLSDEDAATVHRAGLIHDLGRSGVPAAVWNKTDPLTPSEWERVKEHPSLTELVLARSGALGHLGTLAGLHHERLDGSGYRGVSASFLPVAAQILAAAGRLPHEDRAAPTSRRPDAGRCRTRPTRRRATRQARLRGRRSCPHGWWSLGAAATQRAAGWIDRA